MICPQDQQPCTMDHSLACSAACLQQITSRWGPPQGPPAPPPVTEAMRLQAINDLMKWERQDVTVKFLIRTVLVGYSLSSIGHLARYQPDAFDDLYEEASALVRNDL